MNANLWQFGIDTLMFSVSGPSYLFGHLSCYPLGVLPCDARASGDAVGQGERRGKGGRQGDV